MRSVVKEKSSAVSRTVEEVSIIDRYGQLDEEIKKLTKLKDALRDKILSTYPQGEHKGQNYTLTIATTQSLVLDPIKVAKELGVKETLMISSVSVEKARALLGAKVDNCTSEIKESSRISVKKHG